MDFTPHPYQKFAIDFIVSHPSVAVFLGLGMGKTVITLTAINQLIYDHFDVNKALIIAPLRVARDTWPEELKKWDHLKDLRVSVMIGSQTTRQQALRTDADIYIINRENLPWLADQTTKHWPFDMVVIDELSSFKNHKAQRFKALVKKLPHITRIVGLTGTPAPNSLMDLWAQFRLLDGGQRLGRFITHYRSQYFDPDKRNGMQIFSYKLKPGAETAIYHQISDITISMKTTDHLHLPPVTYTNHQVTLTKQEQSRYDTLKRDLVLTLDDHAIDVVSAAALSGKLLQMTSGALYDGENTHTYTEVGTSKINTLEDILEATGGHNILVCYWFKHELDRIQKHFPQAKKLDTTQDFQNWNQGKIPLGLIHPASAGHGLNLQTGGHILVWFTTPWSLELYEQANARLNRQGQTHPVSIIHLVAKNTIDEQVTKALAEKSTTQQGLINAVKAELGGNTQ